MPGPPRATLERPRAEAPEEAPRSRRRPRPRATAAESTPDPRSRSPSLVSTGGPAPFVRRAHRGNRRRQVRGAGRVRAPGRRHALHRRGRPRAAGRPEVRDRLASAGETRSRPAAPSRPRQGRRDRLRATGGARWLESLLHPLVGERGSPGGAGPRGGHDVAVVEVPLLFEAGMDEGRSTRRSRWSPTTSCAPSAPGDRGTASLEGRSARQLTQDEKAARADPRDPQRRHLGGPRGGGRRVIAELKGRPGPGGRVSGRTPGGVATARLAIAAALAIAVGGRAGSTSSEVDPRGHAAAAPRRHHPPAGRREGPRPGA